MFTSYDHTPREAVATVLDNDEQATCATVKVSNGEETFVIEYLNHPDDEDAVYNVTTDGLPNDVAGLSVEESGPGYSVVSTDTATVEGVLDDIGELAAATSDDGRVGMREAATKHVTAQSWDPSLREAVSALVQWLNPFAENPRV